MVNSGQRDLVVSLAVAYLNVHVAELNVGEQVIRDHKYFDPPAVSALTPVPEHNADFMRIARKFWGLYSQEKDAWTLDLDLLEG
jgi:hypothetical protein